MKTLLKKSLKLSLGSLAVLKLSDQLHTNNFNEQYKRARHTFWERRAAKCEDEEQ